MPPKVIGWLMTFSPLEASGKAQPSASVFAVLLALTSASWSAVIGVKLTGSPF